MADMPESLTIALQAQARTLLQQDGWFTAGLELLDRMELANIPREGWCWYIPRGALGPVQAFFTATTLVDLPVHEVPAGVPLGLGRALPRCNRQPDCPAHPEPSAALEGQWMHWMDQHQPGWRGTQEESRG